MSPSTSILSLPNEILSEIFDYHSLPLVSGRETLARSGWARWGDTAEDRVRGCLPSTLFAVSHAVSRFRAVALPYVWSSISVCSVCELVSIHDVFQSCTMAQFVQSLTLYFPVHHSSDDCWDLSHDLLTQTIRSLTGLWELFVIDESEIEYAPEALIAAFPLCNRLVKFSYEGPWRGLPDPNAHESDVTLFYMAHQWHPQALHLEALALRPAMWHRVRVPCGLYELSLSMITFTTLLYDYSQRYVAGGLIFDNVESTHPPASHLFTRLLTASQTTLRHVKIGMIGGVSKKVLSHAFAVVGPGLETLTIDRFSSEIDILRVVGPLCPKLVQLHCKQALEARALLHTLRKVLPSGLRRLMVTVIDAVSAYVDLIQWVRDGMPAGLTELVIYWKTWDPRLRDSKGEISLLEECMFRGIELISHNLV